jgi:5-formyltetrahydrofolate cyclo-ligase
MPPEERVLGSQAVSERLIRDFEKKPPHSVALYSAMGTEVALNELAQWCLLRGIPLAYPRMDTTHFSGMVFYQADPSRMEQWEHASFGFKQPRADTGLPEWQAQSAKDVILVPGLLFGLQGERMGRGKGHYDRYLASCPAFRIGVAFDIQVTQGLGQQPWDQAVHALVTPTRWIGTVR